VGKKSRRDQTKTRNFSFCRVSPSLHFCLVLIVFYTHNIVVLKEIEIEIKQITLSLTRKHQTKTMPTMRDFATRGAGFFFSVAECASSSDVEASSRGGGGGGGGGGRMSAFLGGGRGSAGGVGSSPSDSKSSSSSGKHQNAAFDPEALERGAKALREINKSPYAKNVIELSGKQEVTKQTEARAEEARMNAVAAQHATEREKVMWEQQRKLETQRAEQNAQLKQYEDELARKRQQAENEAARARNAELVKMQEQAAERAEALRRDTERKIQAEKRATEEFKAKLEQENMRAKAIAEAEGRTLENRQNEDVIRRQMLAKVEAETTKAIKVVQEAMVYFGRGATELLSNPQQMTMLVGGLSVLAAGVYSSREGAKFGFKQLEKYLGQPSLIRETSRGAFWKPQSAGANILGDVQLEKSMETRVKQLATATANTRARKAPFRNILLYGPPGTGKTMAAKRLARHSGLDYALMTGGDVAPLGASAVTKIHEMFDWAGTSRKGLLLFIDEADAFLAKRGGNVASQETRSALNALLYRTGEMSRDVTLVMATNRPEDLDSAVLDRVDETMEFALPDEETRFRLVKQYFDKLIVRGADPGDEQPSRTFLGGIMKTLGFGKIPDRPVPVNGVTEEHLRDVAKKTVGFSGREISKLMASVQSAAHGSDDGAATPEMLKTTTQFKIQEHANKTKAFAAEANQK